MSAESYGKNTKRIVFTETDHRHAQLIVKLKMDGVTQAKFFRSLITAYLGDDDIIRTHILKISDLSQKRSKKSLALREQGKKITQDLGLEESQVDSIFDLIAEEFPDL
jgi:hypothetical protein